MPVGRTLPRDVGGLAAVEARLDAATLAGWVAALRDERVDVSLFAGRVTDLRAA